MPFLTHSATCKLQFGLASHSPFDSTCKDGYDNPYSDGGPLLGPSLPNLPVKAQRRLPNNIQAKNPPKQPGIYLLTLSRGSNGSQEFYLGKASNLRQRLQDYIEMTRRLLALYFQHPVWRDGNGFRFVHYRLADTLLSQGVVEFEYFTVPHTYSKQDLARLELLEMSDLVVSKHAAGASQSSASILNCFDAFKSTVHTAGLTPNWAAVQALLQ